MRIVIDARMLYWTGVGRYTKALLDNLAEIDHENNYVVITRPEDRQLWEPTTSNFKRVEVAINPYSVGEQSRLARVLRDLAPDLVHFTAANAPVSYSGKRIVTIHDLTLIDFDTSRGVGVKKLVRKLKRLPFRWVLRHDVKYAQLLMTPTQYVKDQLVKRYHADPDKVRVTWLAADKNLAEPASLERFNLGDDFLLYVGTAYPYKNVGLIIDALKTMASSRPNLKLAITSQPDYFRDQLESKVHELGLEERVIFTGFVSDGELVSLYRNARVYICPSLSEGFGLQSLESMIQGLPVLASNASCLQEICGDAAVYFDPRSPSELAEKIGTLLEDEKRRHELTELGFARVKQFSWQKMTNETLEAYLSVVSSPVKS